MIATLFLSSQGKRERDKEKGGSHVDTPSKEKEDGEGKEGKKGVYLPLYLYCKIGKARTELRKKGEKERPRTLPLLFKRRVKEKKKKEIGRSRGKGGGGILSHVPGKKKKPEHRRNPHHTSFRRRAWEKEKGNKVRN